MTSREYITLQMTDTSGSTGIGAQIKFKVVQGGWKPIIDKVSNVSRTLGGLDIQEGGIYRSYNLIIVTKDIIETDTGYGTRENLEEFYCLNDSSGSPSSTILLEDSFGQAHRCVMVGQHIPEPASTILSGYSTRYFTPISLVVIP